jgi:amino acid transporter
MTTTKTLKLRDLTLFTVSAILLLETLSSTASIGVSSLFWWMFLGLTFFVPYGLMNAEMGTTYPEQGGIYAWVRDAFGRRWASRVTWSYWVNNLLWTPSLFIFFAGIVNQLFSLELGLVAQIGMGIVLTWLAVLANVLPLSVGKWVPNIGAALKVGVFIALIAGALLHAAKSGIANDISWTTVRPSLDDSLKYLPTVIYGMLGFELMCANADEIRNPSQDLPRAVLLSGVIIILFYAFGTFAILVAVPLADVNLVEGLVDTLYLFFGQTAGGRFFVFILGIAVLYTVYSNVVTWCIGCNRAAQEAAAGGELPAALAIEHPRYKTPLGAAIAMGIVSTLVLILYGALARNSEGLFWSLFACSAVIFLLPYAGMLLAFARMRRIDPDRPRPYRVPVSNRVATIMAGYCALIVVAAALLLMVAPGSGFDWPVTIGVAVTFAVGELVIRYAESRRIAAGLELAETAAAD